MTTYTAVVTKWDNGFEVAIDDVGVTQAEALEDVAAMARDYIALDLGVPEESIDLEILWLDGQGVRKQGSRSALAKHPHIYIPESVPLEDLEPWEQGVWLTPGVTVAERRLMIAAVRLSRGELTLAEFDGLKHEVLSGG